MMSPVCGTANGAGSEEAWGSGRRGLEHGAERESSGMDLMGERKIEVSSWFRNSVTEKTVLLLTEVEHLKLHVMMASRKREDFLM